tara:strand:- start:208 stop:963 length:756 start_codon:yes stop_codon:yes gene_type:complete
MSKINVNTVAPSSAVDLTLGASGDDVLVPSGATLKANKIFDAGGNNVITSDGSGNLTVNASMAGDMALITTQDFDDVASLEIKASATTGFNTDYPIYLMKLINVFPEADGGTLQLDFSTDDGSSYAVTKTTVLSRVYRTMSDGTSAVGIRPGSYMRGDSTSVAILATADCDRADNSYQGDIWFFNLGSASIYKYFWGALVSQYPEGAGATDISMYGNWSAGRLKTTSDIDAIKVLSSAGNITGSIKLFGIN